MKHRVQSWLLFPGAVALFLLGMSLSAQQALSQSSAPGQQSNQAQPPDTQNPPPAASQSQTSDAQGQWQQDEQPAQQQAQPDQAPPPDRQGQSAPTEAQTFTGTIVKSGNKYVFQDAATGKSYDIDHQDEVQKYEGKKVKVHGTLDESRKMIHIQ